MNRIKQWILYNVIARLSYKSWIRYRMQTRDEYGERICYCGHTTTCNCADPDMQLYRDSVKRGTASLRDLKEPTI